MINSEDIERRAARATLLKEQGYNCSQAVVAACADLYGIDEQTALRLSASFGGGIAQMRLTCGAACGMFLLAGLENGNVLPNRPELKQTNYRLVQKLARDFEQEHGSLTCADLLGLNGQPPKQKMPCKLMVAAAVKQYLNEINNS